MRVTFEKIGAPMGYRIVVIGKIKKLVQETSQYWLEFKDDQPVCILNKAEYKLISASDMGARNKKDNMQAVPDA